MWTIVKIVFFRIFVTKLPRFTMKHDPRRSLTMAHSEVIVLAMLSAATPGSMWHLKPWLGWVSPWSIHVGGTVYLPTLRIMGSQNWWFGDPRTLLYRFKPFYRRVQRFLGYMNSRYLDGFSGREKKCTVPFVPWMRSVLTPCKRTCQEVYLFYVVSHMFYFHPKNWVRFPFWLYNIFQMGWSHQLDNYYFLSFKYPELSKLASCWGPSPCVIQVLFTLPLQGPSWSLGMDDSGWYWLVFFLFLGGQSDVKSCNPHRKRTQNYKSLVLQSYPGRSGV